MKKKTIKVIASALILVICFAMGASASGLLQTIEAYLNYGITIKLDGQEQVMYDAVGTRVYPISYQGTTYVPIRAVSNMLGIDVNWDGTTDTVLLGKTGEYKDFIESFLPYYIGGNHYKYADGQKYQFGNIEYNHFVKVSGYPEGKTSHGSCSVKYELGGKYTEIVIDIYLDDAKEMPLKIIGDNGKVLGQLNLSGNSLTREIKIPVYGVNQITIQSASDLFHYYTFYILDAKIK